MQSAGFNFQQNFFELFGLPMRYQIDEAQLNQRFHTLQAEVHPDKFASFPEAERRVSMQWATKINEAYQTLHNSTQRARYLLSLHGVDTQEETNTAMPADFLMQQMEWREAIEEAQQTGDAAALDELESRMQHEMRQLEIQLAVKIDNSHDYLGAASDVRKLKFMEKLAEEISSAFDAIDN